MDIKKSTDINMDIHDFLCQSSIIHTMVDIYIDIQAGIFIQGYPQTIDIHE